MAATARAGPSRRATRRPRWRPDGEDDGEPAHQHGDVAVEEVPKRRAAVEPGRRGVRPGGRRRGDRRDHELHEHLEPVGHARRRPARPQRRRARPAAQAVGQDLPRARLEGGHRLPRPRRADRAARGSSASTSWATAARPASATPGPCRTRSRQAIEAEDLTVCSVLSGNRNFEGRIHPEVKMNYLASPPLCVAYALAGRMDLDIARGPARRGRRRRAGLPARPLAHAGGGQRRDRVRGRVRHVPQELRRGVRGRRELGVARDPRGRPLRLGRGLHLRQAPALLRGHAGRRARGLRRDRGRARDRRCSATA